MGQRSTRLLYTNWNKSSKKTLIKIKNKLVTKIEQVSSKNEKLGGSGSVVLIDETMLNYKCKSNRKRSPNNKTDALCIVEVRNKITNVFGCVIENKEAATIMPIICERVVGGAQIHTDEHRTYKCLQGEGYTHKSVCHKYDFFNKINGAHTQHVESFNSCLKVAIQKRKGVRTYNRPRFLLEFSWKFNNSEDIVQELFNLMGISLF